MFQRAFPYFDGCIVVIWENVLVCRGSWSFGLIICSQIYQDKSFVFFYFLYRTCNFCVSKLLKKLINKFKGTTTSGEKRKML